MASTFHFFPKLPCELRIWIWKLALRPSTDIGGMHYFLLEHKEKVDSTDSISIVDLNPWGEEIDDGKIAVMSTGPLQSGSPATPVNKSVYLWDAGLFTACKESRDIIVRRREEYDRRPRVWPRRVSETYTVTMTRRREDELWCLMFQPEKDIFCYTFGDWDLLGTSRQDLLQQYVEHTYLGIPGDIKHVAIEFDSSWTLDWPETYEELERESSPRAFILRLLEGCIQRTMKCFVWVIDRQSILPEVSLLKPPACEFYDLEVGYHQPIHDTEASDFIDRMDAFFTPRYCLWEEPYSPHSSNDEELYSDLRDFVNVLVPQK